MQISHPSIRSLTRVIGQHGLFLGYAWYVVTTTLGWGSLTTTHLSNDRVRDMLWPPYWNERIYLVRVKQTRWRPIFLCSFALIASSAGLVSFAVAETGVYSHCGCQYPPIVHPSSEGLPLASLLR